MTEYPDDLPSMATMLREQKEEIERLWKRIRAADDLAEVAWEYREEYGHGSLADAVETYRATEER